MTSMRSMSAPGATERPVTIAAGGGVHLDGDLVLPPQPVGVVLFSHGSGSGRHSPRNRAVAAQLHEAGLATLLFDLLTPQEDRFYENRFDIALLSERLAAAVQFVLAEPGLQGLPVGLFGASTGAASALRVAAALPGPVAAVVSRGGRPDLAGETALQAVRAPTLLIVGSLDTEVIALNHAAAALMVQCVHELSIVPGATHLFEEPGTLDEMARRAQRWFSARLAGTDRVS